uniref:Uncharacterized protein n=1 Tax=Anguilla anguilla TaxID=7936 RepID=A0A0E9VD24_ANGAN
MMKFWQEHSHDASVEENDAGLQCTTTDSA